MKNVEIKARYANHEFARSILREHNSVGDTDHQIDTYFDAPFGRLKLRQGNVENALISYHRENQFGPKKSDYRLHRIDPAQGESLKECLVQSLGIRVVVDKVREIYFVGNVKIHLDTVEGLGQFIEIEARDEADVVDIKVLEDQCNDFMRQLMIAQDDLLSESYSDMLLDKDRSERRRLRGLHRSMGFGADLNRNEQLATNIERVSDAGPHKDNQIQSDPPGVRGNCPVLGAGSGEEWPLCC